MACACAALLVVAASAAPAHGMCDSHRGACARVANCSVRAHDEHAAEWASELTLRLRSADAAPAAACPLLPRSAWPCECVPHGLAAAARRRLDDVEANFVKWFVFVGWLAPLCFLVLLIKLFQDCRAKGCSGWLDSCRKTHVGKSRKRSLY